MDIFFRPQRRCLHNLLRRVVNIAGVSPESALRWCNFLPGVQCRALVAGGDGTVGWILETIEKLDLKPPPQVAVLSLGTGNDLSRVLGWGPGHTGEVNVTEMLTAVARAVPVKLDRWTVSLKQRRNFGIHLTHPDKKLTMSNYFSIGVDASVTLSMHNSRQSLPRGLSSRLLTKLLFFTFGTKDVLEHACKDLQDKVELFLDGKKIDLPPLEGIVVLNIPSWGGGVKVWQLGDASSWPEQRIDDGLFEVFGLYSSFHIAQMQVGMSEPFRIGQGRELSLRIFHKGRLPMQVDGEPWEQGPATINIQRKCQASMLASTDYADETSSSSSSSDEKDSTQETDF
uniref:Diacylglycerol kinase n=1 Tax=Plectus sambesii TaxID=2011161 RepID=A0A914VCY2_9BILA